MKKIVLLSLLAFVLSFLVVSFNQSTYLYADKCVNCNQSKSKNGMKQCALNGRDTSSTRKKCRKAGCKITGNSSCSTAANGKVWDPNKGGFR